MNEEAWVIVKEFRHYAVSNLGRVKRLTGGRGTTAGRILKQRTNRDGYLCVTLQEGDRRKGYLVSRLVCEAFYGPPPPGYIEAAHKDGNRANNRLGNLRWATKAENEADKRLHGTIMRGEGHPNSKLTEEQVAAIRSDTRPQAAIARDYGVAQSLICLVKNRKIWDHV